MATWHVGYIGDSTNFVGSNATCTSNVFLEELEGFFGCQIFADEF